MAEPVHIEILRICQLCNGDGKVGETQEDDCPRCEGEGRHVWGYLKVTEGKVNQIQDMMED